MFYKIFKTINNKFNRLFKFIFFLRYLFAIFLAASLIFLLIPQFFDYNKRQSLIKFHLLKIYDLEIKKMDEIKFHSFPFPHLVINNLEAIFHSKQNTLKIKQLIISPNILSIYDYNNFKIRKIKFKNNNLDTDLITLKYFFKKILNHDNNLKFQDLNLKIKDVENNIVDLKEIYFSNYGYEKNKIIGVVFGRKFKIEFFGNLNNFDFKILDSGLSLRSKVLKNNGEIIGKVIKSNFKLNYIFDEKKIKIYNFFFRDKNLSFDSEGIIEFKPYFKNNMDFDIKNINTNLFKNLNIRTIQKSKDLIKRLNSENEIIFRTKKLTGNLIEDLKINTKLIYGRLEFFKIFLISGSTFSCRNNLNLLEEFPIIYFNCLMESPDKRKLLKKMDIDYKIKKEKLLLKVDGNLNILNNKINFDNLIVNKNTSSQDDLNYYKNAFENIVFNENFLKIFDLSKIRKFIIEIS